MQGLLLLLFERILIYMKVLILSLTVGNGHNACAKSLMKALQKKSVDCQFLDVYGYINPILRESVDRAYLISTSYSPLIYSQAYRLAEKRNPGDKKIISVHRMTQGLFSKKLSHYIDEYAPDVIVCTHIFAAQIVTEIKNIRAKSIGIITDFTIHPFWEDTKLDYYVTAHELLNNQFIKKSLPIEKCLPIGIPIDPKFSIKIDKKEARRRLCLADETTVLVMGGSMGFGNMDSMIKRLDNLDLDFQIITICGNNKRLKRKIDHLRTNKILYNYGFINNVDLFMDASDCICTKPGGLTVSEALAKSLPIIMPSAIPGQEERNMEFLQNNGIGMRSSSTFKIDECMYQFLSAFERRKKIYEESIKYIAKPNSTRDLVEFILNIR